MSDPVAHLQWTCDSCAKQAVTLLLNPSLDFKDVPDGWVRLGVLTNAGAVHGVRWLCDDCAGFIRRELPNALGLGDLT